MLNYAVFDGHSIINVVVADDKESIESIFAPNQCISLEDLIHTVEVVVTGDNGEQSTYNTEITPSAGWYLEEGVWYAPKPGENYFWNGQSWIEVKESTGIVEEELVTE